MPNTTNYQKHINQNPIQRLLIQNFYNSFFKVIKPLKAKRVLDVGCGEGFTLKKLQDRKIGVNNVGIDNSTDAIRLGKKIYPDLNLQKGNIYDINFKDKSFDLVLCTEVLEHLDDPDKAIEEMKRVSSKYLLFSVPNEPFFMGAHLIKGQYLKSFGNHPEHINHWTFWGFERMLEKHGLKIVKKRYPFAWTMILAKI